MYSIIAILLPILTGIILWEKLPGRIAVHFDFGGVPDNYCSKGFAVFGIFSIILILHLFTAFCTASENEKGEGIPDKFYHILLWLCPFISIFVAVLIYGNALGIKLDVPFWAMLMVGFLYMILGNYMPKLRKNKFTGLRIRWTFESTKNWEHTNRFSGYIMFIIGILTVIMALTRFYNTATAHWMPVIWICLLFLSILSMIVYSGIYYWKHKDDEDYFD